MSRLLGVSGFIGHLSGQPNMTHLDLSALRIALAVCRTSFGLLECRPYALHFGFI
jgi:hypothetical protein